MRSAYAVGLVVLALAGLAAVGAVVLVGPGTPPPPSPGPSNGPGAPVAPPVPDAEDRDPDLPARGPRIVVPVAEEIPAPPPPRRLPELGPEPEVPAEKVPGRGATYAPPGYEAAVGEVDWRAVGVWLRRAVKASRAHVRDLRAGREGGTSFEDFQTAWSEAFALTAPVCGVIGPSEWAPSIGQISTHPVLQANWIGAFLEACAHPLTTEQAEAVRTAAAAAVTADAAFTFGPDTWSLERHILRHELRDAFRRAIDAALTEDQRYVLGPPEVRDRLRLDPFSPANYWREFVLERMPDEPFDAVAMGYLGSICMAADFPEAPTDTVYPPLAERLRTDPTALPKVPNDLLTRKQFHLAPVLLDAARKTLATGRWMRERGLFTERQYALARARTQNIVVPYRD